MTKEMKQLTAELLSLKEELNHACVITTEMQCSKRSAFMPAVVGCLKNKECKLLRIRKKASRRDPGFNLLNVML